MVIPKALEGGGIGRESSLGFLARGETQPLEQDLPKLLSGIHVELLSGRFMDQPPEAFTVSRELVA